MREVSQFKTLKCITSTVGENVEEEGVAEECEREKEGVPSACVCGEYVSLQCDRFNHFKTICRTY